MESNFLAKRVEQDDPDFKNNADIKWNFTKFLVDRKGRVIRRFEPDYDMKLIEEEVAKHCG